MSKKKVMFLCTGNSCRSQMAEGFARYLKGDFIEAFSAGTKKHGLNPYAVRVMKEEGVDISHQISKTVDELLVREFDLVITVCGDAHENCPFFPGANVKHVGFEDPPRLTEGIQDEQQVLEVYRRVRDEIKSFIERLELP